MSELRTRMIRDMQLRNFAKTTQEAYLRAVKYLVKFYGKSPDQINQQEIEDYLLFLKYKRKLSWNTCHVVVSGLKFFYNVTLKKNAIVLDLPPAKTRKKLPEILSKKEVKKIIGSANNLKHRIILMTTYSAGLRVSEVVRLRPEHINSERMMIRIEQAKGNKDRYTVLSETLLEELRQYWKKCRPQGWLFPSIIPGRHITIRSAQRVYETARQNAGITKGSGIHMLRHCFATHLLDSGYDIRKIQILLGHRSLSTTMRYLHVTKKAISLVKSPLDSHRQTISKEDTDDTDN